MLTRLRLFTAVFLLTLSLAQFAHAAEKYYHYNGNLPFVEMMLNMMTVMGILDKVPPQLMYNRYGGYNGLNNGLNSGLYNRYSRYYNNPLLRNALLRRQGINPYGLNSLGLNPLSLGGLGVNPLTMGSLYNPAGLNSLGLNPLGLDSPLGNSPLGNSFLGNSLWGNPLWGNSLGLSSLSTSPWNNALLGGFPGRSYTGSPFLADDIFASPYSRRSAALRSPLRKYANSYGHGGKRDRYAASPLAKLSRKSHPVQPDDAWPEAYDEWDDSDWAQNPWAADWSDPAYADDSPCVTEFCGLLRPGTPAGVPGVQSAYLNGLWVTDSGEMLGIKNNRFLWSDGDSRYLTGTIRAVQDMLVANVDGETGRVMQYRYRIDNNRLMTQDPSGLVRVFNRVPVN